MHDERIVSYNMDFQKKSLVIRLYNNIEKKYKRIIFSDVLTHSFKCIIGYNIIFDICECEIGSFISDNLKELKEMEGFCWPVDYQTFQDLNSFLVDNQYKYIKINCSYGMFGWILAKFCEVYG